MNSNLSTDVGQNRKLLVRRTLVVGLGGTGCLAVQETLNRVRHRFRNRRPAFCEFLAVDTTAEEIQEVSHLNVDDFVHIGGFDANPFFEHLRRYPFLQWLPKDRYRPGEINVGAQGIPHLGRFCYFMKREGTVYPAVERKLLRLTSPALPNTIAELDPSSQISLDRNAGVWIHLITSLCGGTGAGCFLDSAYDLRRWCQQITGRRPRIIAHLVMPETFRIRSSATRRQFQAITYAMLTQVNHFMNLNEATIEYKDGTEVKWPKHELPFDFCFLLGGTSAENAISRYKWLRHIGQMITLLVAEHAGKALLDQMINVYPRQQSQGTKQEEMRVFSSYGLMFGKRPERAKAKRVFREDALRSLGQFAARPQQIPLFPGALEPFQDLGSFKMEEARRTLLGDFPRQIEDLLEAAVKSKVQIGPAERGKRIRTYLRSFFDGMDDDSDAAQRALQIAKDHVPPFSRGGPFPKPIREFLQTWCEDRRPVEQLRGQVRELRRKLVEQSTSALREAAREYEDVRKRIQDYLDTRPELLADKGREIVEDASLHAEKCLEWARRRSEAEVFKLLELRLVELDECLVQIAADSAALLEQAASSADQEESVSGDSDDALQLYDVEPKALKDDVLLTDRTALLKGLLGRLLRGEHRSRNYARELEELLEKDDESRAAIEEFLDRVLQRYEDKQARAGNLEMSQIGELKSRLQDCFKQAKPYWLVEDDKHVEEVACAVFPDHEPLVNAFKELVGEETFVAQEKHQEDVCVCRTQHGAALRDLKNFTTEYEKAYREMMKLRWEATIQDGQLLQKDMCLDSRWTDIFPPPAPDERVVQREHVAVGFAFLLFGRKEIPGRPEHRREGDVHVWVGTVDGAERTESLGSGDYVSAYQRWSNRAELVDATLEAINSGGLEERIDEGTEVLRKVRKGLLDPGNEKVRRVFTEMKNAVEQQVRRWENETVFERGETASALQDANAPKSSAK